MKQPDYEKFFRNYVEVSNRSATGEPDTDAIRASYAEYVVAAGANGAVQGGANDETYADILRQGAGFNQAIGMVGMTVMKVEATEVDGDHDMVRPFFRADYQRKDGSSVSIEFDMAYFCQRRPDGPRIFAFVAGDEMALYREKGLVGEDGKPA